MVGSLFTTGDLDKDGRQLVLDDSIRHVSYYTTEGEGWDKQGTAGQSWSLENYRPGDTFDTAQVASDRWSVVGTTQTNPITALQEGGKLTLGVEKDEGKASLSSHGKWALVGDFDVRLYIDWSSYYNEYRSISHTYLKVAADDKNAARVSFEFDGTGFSFSSEKTIGRDLKFFDWKNNGAVVDVASFSIASQYQYIRLTREAGVISAYIYKEGTLQQVGDEIEEESLEGPLYIEFGVEAKELNTYRSSFNKIFVSSDSLSPPIKFFSYSRGEDVSFPERTVIAVDDFSLSIIDEQKKTLWARFLFGEGSPLADSDTRVSACNGTIYCTTDNGLVAFDFHRDRVFKYLDDTIYISDEPLSMRNSSISFSVYKDNIGSFPSNVFYDVACQKIGQDEYVALATDTGVTVIRALASGVATCTDGPLPGKRVEISNMGALRWSGFNAGSNQGELSTFSNIVSLSGPSDVPFNRTNYFSPSTPYALLGSDITSFSTQTVANTDITAVGTTEGITFLAFSPATVASRALTYGVETPAANPIEDPSFEEYLGIHWVPFVLGGFHEAFRVQRSQTGVTDGSYNLLLYFDSIDLFAKYEEGMSTGVYQDVNLSGVERIYLDLSITDPSSTVSFLVFEVLVGETVVKSYQDVDGPFTAYNVSINVLPFEGIHRLTFRVRVVLEANPTFVYNRKVYVDNIRTQLATSEYPILPPGNAAVEEVLLQYDSAGHKIYFSTAEGYGAVDLDANSLDFFARLEDHTGLQEAETLSADFGRVESET